ncbi:hypothetical protein [Kitasatospora indigofera]|uniref:hypothetical protein n=1 Tax=Kitasatospora indigofera TaxID=67307 RepID=UPI0036A44D17
MTTDQAPGGRRLPTAEDVETLEEYVIGRTFAACRLAEVGTESHRIAVALQTAVGDIAATLRFNLMDHQEARAAEKHALAARITAGWNRLVDIAAPWHGEPEFPDGRAERIPDGSLRDDPKFMAAVRAYRPSAEEYALADSLLGLADQADATDETQP